MPVAAGIVFGLVAAWVASCLLQRFLFEVSPLDPLTYAAAAVILSASAALACYLPARRVTRSRCPALKVE